MTDRELMQQVLDAMLNFPNDISDEMFESIRVLRARLAQPEPEELGEVIPADEEQLKRIAKLIEPEPVATLFGSLPVYDVPSKQEPVAWMHNFIDEVVIAHRPADLDRHPDRWTALYKDPTPCQTCEALARTVMMDQVSYDIPPRHREPPTQDLSAPLTVNGVPMYPQREWQGLTDDEIEKLYLGSFDEGQFARAIEAKLRERNQ